MGRGDDVMGQWESQPAAGRQKTPAAVDAEESLFIRFLRTFKEVLKFVLFSYTVLFGALLLARWTTYFIVAK